MTVSRPQLPPIARTKWCEAGQHWHSGRDCPRGHDLWRGEVPGVARTETPRATSGVGARPATSRPGKQHEDALAAALVASGLEVIDYPAWMQRALEGGIFPVIVREFPVGLLLDEPRRFRADFFHPLTRLCVELEGGAHGVQRQRKSDILREQLLTAAGLRVVRVLPEQVHDNTALAIVRAALEVA